MNQEPSVDYVSPFDSYIDALTDETGTFVIRLVGRPPLVFRKTRDMDDLEDIKRKVKNAASLVTEKMVPDPWKPYVGSGIRTVVHAAWLSGMHVGCLVWQDCPEPQEPGPSYRKIDDQWQEEVLVRGGSPELTFLKMAKKDATAFESLIQGFFENVGVGWSSSDAAHFREANEAVRE